MKNLLLATTASILISTPVFAEYAQPETTVCTSKEGVISIDITFVYDVIDYATEGYNSAYEYVMEWF